MKMLSKIDHVGRLHEHAGNGTRGAAQAATVLTIAVVGIVALITSAAFVDVTAEIPGVASVTISSSSDEPHVYEDSTATAQTDLERSVRNTIAYIERCIADHDGTLPSDDSANGSVLFTGCTDDTDDHRDAIVTIRPHPVYPADAGLNYIIEASNRDGSLWAAYDSLSGAQFSSENPEQWPWAPADGSGTASTVPGSLQATVRHLVPALETCIAAHDGTLPTTHLDNGFTAINCPDTTNTLSTVATLVTVQPVGSTGGYLIEGWYDDGLLQYRSADGAYTEFSSR